MKNRFFSRCLTRAATVALVAAPLMARAAGEPLDLSATGTTVAGYVAVAAGIGAGVFGAIYGVRIIIKAFKAVAK